MPQSGSVIERLSARGRVSYGRSGSTVTAQYSVYMEGILLDALEAQAAAYEERSKANLHLKETTSHMMLKPAKFIEL